MKARLIKYLAHHQAINQTNECSPLIAAYAKEISKNLGHIDEQMALEIQDALNFQQHTVNKHDEANVQMRALNTSLNKFIIDMAASNF